MLPAIKYETGDGYYQLTERVCIQTGIRPPNPIEHRFYSLASNGLMCLEVGYAWNGANDAFDTHDFMLPSLVHDCFCQMVRDKKLPNKYRWQADSLLAKQLKESGMPAIRRFYISLAVKVYGRIVYR